MDEQSRVRERNRVMEAILTDEDTLNFYWELFDLWGEPPDPSVESDYAYHGRMYENMCILVEHGGFSMEDAYLAITSREPDAKEGAARWVREEMNRVRSLQRKPGAAPVRRKQTMSYQALTSLATTLFETCGQKWGSEVIRLLHAPTSEDGHRASLSQKTERMEIMLFLALIERHLAQQGRQIASNLLAKELGVSPSTITRFRDDAQYPFVTEIARVMLLHYPEFFSILYLFSEFVERNDPAPA